MFFNSCDYSILMQIRNKKCYKMLDDIILENVLYKYEIQ